MLFTKCILSKRSHEDGLRISVMSRHTLEDGRTPDSRIRPEMFDFHFPILGPSPVLIGGFHKRMVGWQDFVIRYQDELNDPFRRGFAESLARVALATDVTLLCIEPDPMHCHRRLLAQVCRSIVPELAIAHR